MFVRIFRRSKGQEFLVNVNLIANIEVEYAVPNGDGNYSSVVLEQGLASAEAVRCYKVHVAGEEFFLKANPNDPVMTVFEAIYKNAIKG